MSTLSASGIALACILSGVVLGTVLRSRLPEQQISEDAKDVIKMSAAFIATLSALVLGLLIATAKSSFDSKIGQVKQLAADVIMLDELFAQYGPETSKARKMGRRNFELMIDEIWHEHESENQTPFELNREAQAFLQEVYLLAPQNDLQRSLKTRIVETLKDLAQARLALFVQSGSTISTPFLMILTFWLTILFAIFGLLTRINAVVGVTLMICALSVSTSIFLVLDFDRAFEGIIRIPSEPLRNALPPLNP